MSAVLDEVLGRKSPTHAYEICEVMSKNRPKLFVQKSAGIFDQVFSGPHSFASWRRAKKCPTQAPRPLLKRFFWKIGEVYSHVLCVPIYSLCPKFIDYDWSKRKLWWVLFCCRYVGWYLQLSNFMPMRDSSAPATSQPVFAHSGPMLRFLFISH